MRRSHTSLSARDACRSLWQPPHQHRVLSSAAIYLGYTVPASPSASSSSSSSPLFAFTRALRVARPLFALAYSTSNPAYPLPGSNNEIDPRGFDESLFEAQDDVYHRHASASTIIPEASATQPNGIPAAMEVYPTLSAPTQLLNRLIQENNIEAATTVLHELTALGAPLDEPLPSYSSAALWAIRNGKKHDMLAWMRLCPGYAPGTKYFETCSTSTYSKQVRSVATNFRKCIMIILDSYGDDLRLLQRASMIAAEKGLWSVLQSTLAQVLRFGVGRISESDAAKPALAWQYFSRLVQANQSQRGLKDQGRRKAILSATVQLRKLYNLGIRTLALAGRLDDAVQWAEKSTEANSSNTASSQILRVEPFTENLLIEELVAAGAERTRQARRLADRLAYLPSRRSAHKPVDVDAIIERFEREAAYITAANETDYAAKKGSVLDKAIQAHLEQGDVVAAREYLLSTLQSVTRIGRGEDDFIPALDPSAQTSDSVFAHLPSASVLSELYDMANKFGTIAVTVSLTETDMQHLPAASGEDQFGSQETLTADEFLRPIRDKLLHVRGGKGLWQTARLYSYVKKGKWKEAVQFYVGKAGFKVPCGGITMDLVSLTLDQQALPKASKEETVDKWQGVKGKHWPSTHAINLMLKAIAGACVDAKDYKRLTQVYNLWKESSLPVTSLGQTEETDDVDDLTFQQWPPSQRPDSYTFDPFIRAFGRLNIEVQPTFDDGSDGNQTKVEKQVWGSSQAVLDVIRDMTDLFFVRPSISTWTIALECLAREGRDRWTTATSILAHSLGIHTTSPLSSTPPVTKEAQPEARASFAPANLATYTALMRALIRVPREQGGSMVEQAAAIRDDLLLRTLNLDIAVRPLVRAEKEGVSQEEGQKEVGLFWSDLLGRWQALHQATLMQGGGGSRDDSRQRWEAEAVLHGNQGRTIEAMREVWLLEPAQRASDNETPSS